MTHTYQVQWLPNLKKFCGAHSAVGKITTLELQQKHNPWDKVTCTNCYQSCASHQDGRSPERETLPPLEGPGGGGGRVPGTILSNPWGWAQPLRSRTHENLKGDQKRFRDKGLGGGGSESAVGGHFFLGSTQWLSSRVCIRDTIMEGGG